MSTRFVRKYRRVGISAHTENSPFSPLRPAWRVEAGSSPHRDIALRRVQDETGKRNNVPLAVKIEPGWRRGPS